MNIYQGHFGTLPIADITAAAWNTAQIKVQEGSDAHKAAVAFLDAEVGEFSRQYGEGQWLTYSNVTVYDYLAFSEFATGIRADTVHSRDEKVAALYLLCSWIGLQPAIENEQKVA